MKLLNLEIPRLALFTDVCIAALAAVGITILTGAQAHAVLGVPLLTAVLTLALVAVASRAGIGPAGAESVLTDPATGLATQEVAEDVLAREFAAARRGRLLTIVLVRLDGLESYRSEHGDRKTEVLLRTAGRTAARHGRRMDVTAHYDEPGMFLAILSGTDRDGATIFAGRLCDDLLTFKGLPRHEGVSVGIASFQFGMASSDELIRSARDELEGGFEPASSIVVRGGRVAV